MTVPEITEAEIDARYRILDRDAEEGGYHLNPDVVFTRNLVRSGCILVVPYLGFPDGQ